MHASRPPPESSSSTSSSAFIGPSVKPSQLEASTKKSNAVTWPHYPSSLPFLLRERQRHGHAGRFVSREGAGVWSPDPLHRVVGGSPHMLRRLELSAELKGHRGCVNTVSCTPDARYWITGSDDTMLMIWDCESHKRIKGFASGHTDNVFQARALPFTENEKIVTCAADGKVRLTHLSRGESTRLGVHQGRAHRLAVEPGSPHRFMTCGEDGVVLSFDLRTPSINSHSKGSILLKPPGGAGISGMALNPADPNYLFVCGSSPFLDLYDTRKVNAPAARYCPRSLRHSRGHITGCAVNWCGSEVIATYNPIGEVYRFDINNNAVGSHNVPWRGVGGGAAGGDGFRNVRSVRQRVGPPRIPEPTTRSSSGSGGGGGGSRWRGAGGRCSREGGVAEEKNEDADEDEDDEDEDEEEEDEKEDEQEDDDEEDEEAVEEDENDRSFLTKFTGHRNIQTVKQVTFYGPRSEFIASGSDCGHIFIWDKNTAKLEMLLYGDRVGAVNCLEPHPFLPALATSGLSKTAKVWRPTKKKAVPVGQLIGKHGKTEADVTGDNAARAQRADAFRVGERITPQMILNILRVYPGNDEGDDDEDEGDTDAAEGQRGGGGRAAGGRGGGGRGLPRRSLRNILATISSIRLARLPGANGLDSDESGEEEEDEESAEEINWAGRDLMQTEDEEDDDEEEEEQEEEENEDDEVEGVGGGSRGAGAGSGSGEGQEGRLALEGPRRGGAALAVVTDGLSFEVVSSESDSNDNDNADRGGGDAHDGGEAGGDSS